MADSHDFSGSKLPEKHAADIAEALLQLASDSAVRSELPGLNPYAERLSAAIEKGDPQSVEQYLVGLYAQLHSAGSNYSPSEKEILRKRNGYLSYPGGLSPIVCAERFIRPESIVADLGAGNGLQGLLLQRFYPHRKTLQIEISAEMIRIGRIFQRALGIDADRVEWIHDDIVNVSIEDVDFVYIYRPARPHGGGGETYRTIAQKLAEMRKPVVVFSVADCLAGFLDKRFSVFYTDGHLTCFRKE
ncbi:MAG: class I SAM-dependent methyltransferase [Nitrospirota bacterium]